MYVTAAIVLSVYLILYLCSGRQKLEGSFGLQTPFYKMAEFLCGRLAGAFPARIFSRNGVRKKMEYLNPSKALENTLRIYYRKKTALFLEIVFAGTLLSLAVRFTNQGEEWSGEGKIERGSYADGSKSYSLTTTGGDIFELEVMPYILNREEAEELYAEFREELFRVMLGENMGRDEICTELTLESGLEGFPFEVEWETSDPMLVNTLGEVCKVTIPKQVVLSATVSYEDYEWTEPIELTVIPQALDEEQMRSEEIRELLIAAEEQSRFNKNFSLPQEYRGEPLTWRQHVRDNSMWILVAAFGLAFGLFFLSDRDLKKEAERRKELVKRDYPDIVQKFVLYMGAGMTARNTFKKLASDYETDVKNKKAARPAYEEMQYACRELSTGISETEMYERFGRRTGVQEFVRLSTLLQQNTRKGNSFILDRLRQEAVNSMAEKLQKGRKLGEEAGTKLLLPMVMMLLVAMVIIMVPVFLSSMI